MAAAANDTSHDDHGHDAHGHDDHDDHGHDAHGHDDHGSGGDLWVLPPLVVALVIGIVILAIVGLASGASPL